jgi:hypothetical protein
MPDKYLTERLPRMQAELKAWHGAVAEFRKLGINLNDEKYEPLVNALKLWGESLATLRFYDSSEETVVRALAVAMAKAGNNPDALKDAMSRG